MKRKSFAIPFLSMLAAVAVFSAMPGHKVAIDQATRAQAIDALVAGLDKYYLFPDKAKQMVALLRKRQKEGAYDGFKDASKFAAQLDADLASVVQDQHLHVVSSGERWRERIARSLDSAGVEKATHLSPAIGYLKISAFPEPWLTAEKYASAMDELTDTDALIIDLRHHQGGSALSSALLASYFVDRRTRLNAFRERASGETMQLWTADKLAGKPYSGTKPVMILVGPATASAGEDFAYTMQALRRATVVGGRTWGGAHPTMYWRLGDHLRASIPNVLSINPITHSNWEGTGVVPDVAARPAMALAVAKQLLQGRTRVAALP